LQALKGEKSWEEQGNKQRYRRIRKEGASKGKKYLKKAQGRFEGGTMG